MKAFKIEGSFPMGRKRNQRFVREVACKDKEEAREITLSELGSEHGVNRRMIKIKTVKEIKPEEVTSPIVKSLIGVK